MKLEQIMLEWDRDCKIDWTEPSRASIRIPELHNKYLKIYTNDRMKYRKYQIQLKELTSLKYQYYSGDLNNPEDLDEHGWEPFKKIVKTRSGIEKYIEGDKDIGTINDKINYIEEKVAYLDQVMKQINNMSFNIGNFIKWEIFTSGGH